MIQIRLSDPLGLNRVTSIAQPLQEALDARPQMLIDNGWKLLGMPAFVGDPTWRYNIAGRPLFLFPIGLLAYFGFLTESCAAVGVRRSICSSASVAVFGLLPSLFTVLAPSFLRSIAILPAVMVFRRPGRLVDRGALFLINALIAWLLAALVLVSDSRGRLSERTSSIGSDLKTRTWHSMMNALKGTWCRQSTATTCSNWRKYLKARDEPSGIRVHDRTRVWIRSSTPFPLATDP